MNKTYYIYLSVINFYLVANYLRMSALFTLDVPAMGVKPHLGWKWESDDVVKGKRVTVQGYNLISSISSDFYMFTHWSLNMFIRASSQLHGEHTVLQPFRRIEFVIHIAVSVLPDSHFQMGQVTLRVKCLAQGHSIDKMSRYWEGRNMISFENPVSSGIRGMCDDPDVGKSPGDDRPILTFQEYEELVDNEIMSVGQGLILL